MRTAFDQLWAKRPCAQDNPLTQETLTGHVASVLSCAVALGRLLDESVAQLFAMNAHEVTAWRRAVEMGAWLHDLGKANDHFQLMLRRQIPQQGVRHETVSVVIARRLMDWLSPILDSLPSWARLGALFAAAGHHLSFPDPHSNDRPGTKAMALVGHRDFQSVLHIGRERFGLSQPPDLEDFEISLLRRGNLAKELRALQENWGDECERFGEREKALVASIKSTVMSADLAGSSLPKKGIESVEWLKGRLEKTLTRVQLQGVVDSRLKGRLPRPFQAEVRDAPSQTVLVEAGCGSGKTAAAYLWASRRAQGKRLFFCYPTTGTASEGFAGYLADPDFDAILIHGRAETDYRLLENMPARNHEENWLREAGLEALETWPIPAVVCTAHTVLGLLGNVRRGLFAWPSLAQSAFVFDEVHAFSDRLFGYLLRFLGAVPGAPVLLMTATLPPSRRAAIERACRSRGPADVIHGPEEREIAPRYLAREAQADEAWKLAQQILRDNGKVLWIVNTVGRCMSTLREAVENRLPAEAYHSRYRYKDRLRRQRCVIDGFKPDAPSMLAVTTQVAEMSLDLSADLLVSEYAPVPAMIQRMGRLNRAEERPATAKLALFLEPENRLPYSKDEEGDALWREVAGWLQAVCDGKPKSQRDLHERFVSLVEDEGILPEAVGACEWLDGLWRSERNKSSIEEAGFTIDVIRAEDRDAGSATENAIPMPFPPFRDWRTWDREGRFLVAPAGAIDYDEQRGAQWNRHSK